MARSRTRAQFRSKLSEKLMDLGNLALVALALGQFVGGREFSVITFGAGVLFATVCYV